MGCGSSKKQQAEEPANKYADGDSDEEPEVDDGANSDVENELRQDYGKRRKNRRRRVDDDAARKGVSPNSSWKGSVHQPSNFEDRGDAGAAPAAQLEIDFVHGYRGYDTRNTVFYNAEGSAVYITAAIGIVYSPSSHSQRHYIGHPDDIISIAMHPKGRVFATGGLGKDPEIHIWDSVSMERLHVLRGRHERGVNALTFAGSDGSELWSVGLDDDHSIVVWEWAKEKALTQDKGHSQKIFTIGYNAVDDTVVTAGVKHIKFWSRKEDGRLAAKKGLFGKVGPLTNLLDLAFLPSGDCLSAAQTGAIYRWSGRKLETVYANAHDGGCFSLLEMHEGGGIISGGRDGTVKQWTAEMTVARTHTLPNGGDGKTAVVRAIAENEKGTLLVGTKTSEIFEVRAKDGKAKLLVQGHYDGEVWGLDVHPRKKHLAVTVGDDHRILLWDTKSNRVEEQARLPDEGRSVAYSPDGERIAVGLDNGSVVVLDADHLDREKARFRMRKEEISVVRYSPDGRRLAVGSHDNFIDIYDVSDKGDTYEHTGTCKGHSSFITHVDWAADSIHLQSDCGAYEHLFWDAVEAVQIPQSSDLRDTEWASWTCVLGWPVQGIWPGVDKTDVNAVDRSHDSRLLASADDFGLVKLFSYPVYTDEAKYNQFAGHSAHVTNVRFSSDDNKLISVGGGDRTVITWRVVNNK